jgi:putative transposase
MRTSRFTDEQIIGIVKEYEAGAKLTELCRRHGVSPATFYKWRAKYGGMAVSDAKRLRALEEENRRLKQLLAETMLDNQALKGLLAKNWGRLRHGGRRWRPPKKSTGSHAVVPAGWSGSRARWWRGSPSVRATMRGSASACVLLPASAAGSATGGCTSCCAGRASWPTTSSSTGSTKKRSSRSVGGAGKSAGSAA